MKAYGFGLGGIFAPRAAASAPHSSRYAFADAIVEQREGDRDNRVRSEVGGARLLLGRPYVALLWEGA